MISVIYERKAYSEPNLTKSGKQVPEEKTFMLTAEQARIANHKLVKGGRDMIKIVAFAGMIQSLAKKLVIWAFSLIKHPFSRGPGRL